MLACAFVSVLSGADLDIQHGGRQTTFCSSYVDYDVSTVRLNSVFD